MFYLLDSGPRIAFWTRNFIKGFFSARPGHFSIFQNAANFEGRLQTVPVTDKVWTQPDVDVIASTKNLWTHDSKICVFRGERLYGWWRSNYLILQLQASKCCTYGPMVDRQGLSATLPMCFTHLQTNPRDFGSLSGWWFGTFFIFPYIGNNHPNWLIFFRGVQTTNISCFVARSFMDTPWTRRPTRPVACEESGRDVAQLNDEEMFDRM